MSELTTRLSNIVGDTYVITSTEDTAAYLVDWRGNYRGRAIAVIRPANTNEVAAVVEDPIVTPAAVEALIRNEE